MEKFRILLVDDHAVVRLGLRVLLEAIEWLEISGEAETAAEAISAVEADRPDAVLMDIRLPDESGIIACKTITSRWPRTHVIMLTSYSDDTLVRQAHQAGACCYILKQVGNQALIDALDRLRTPLTALPAGIERRWRQRSGNPRRSQKPVPQNRSMRP